MSSGSDGVISDGIYLGSEGRWDFDIPKINFISNKTLITRSVTLRRINNPNNPLDLYFRVVGENEIISEVTGYKDPTNQWLIGTFIAILLLVLTFLQYKKPSSKKTEIKATVSSTTQNLEVGKQEGVIQNIQTVSQIIKPTKPVLLEVCSSLHWEVTKMGGNISKFRTCYFEQYDRPDYSPEPRPREILGKVRKNLMENATYELLPDELKQELDCYYDNCENQYDPLLDRSVRKVGKILKREIGNLRKKKDTPSPYFTYDILNFLKKEVPDKVQLSGGEKCISFYLSTNSSIAVPVIAINDVGKDFRSIKEFLGYLHQQINKEVVVIQLREAQQKLKDPSSTLNRLKSEIRELGG